MPVYGAVRIRANRTILLYFARKPKGTAGEGTCSSPQPSIGYPKIAKNFGIYVIREDPVIIKTKT